MCTPHSSALAQNWKPAVDVKDMKGWRMPVPKGLIEQRTCNSSICEAESQTHNLSYDCWGNFHKKFKVCQ